MNKNRIHDFEFKLTALEIFVKKPFLVTQKLLWTSVGIVSSEQFLKLIKNYLLYLFSFVLNYHFFENCSKIENNLFCILMNSSPRMCILIWSSSSFFLSGLPYFSQMNKPCSFSNPDLKIFLYAFFSIFYKSNNKKLTIIFSSRWYLILIPTVIILAPELITSQEDYFNYFLADLSWSYF